MGFEEWSAEAAAELYGARVARAIAENSRAYLNVGHVLNVRPDPVDQRDFIYEPSLFELKTRYLNDYVDNQHFQVRDQESEGSCVGQAMAAVVDLQNFARYKDKADVPRQVSARYLYQNALKYDEFADDGRSGSSLRGGIKGFYHNGVCNKRLARYFANSPFRVSMRMYDDARRVSLGSYFRLRHILNHYHLALAEVGSILCSAIIHPGWDRAGVAGHNGRIRYGGRGGKSGANALNGAHAFVIVGYNEDGFLVLNSWGNVWGRYEFDGEKRDGIALWRYEDWSDNVLDAWVLRLAAPTRKGSDFVGGYQLSTRQSTQRRIGARKRDVQGHYMHVRDSQYVNEPPYDSDRELIQEIADSFKTATNDAGESYRHLMFFAHGGLNTLREASARADAMIPVFRRNRIYPMFYFWRTGFGSTLNSLIEGVLEQVLERTTDVSDAKDMAIEKLARPMGRAMWNDIRRNADSCFDKPVTCGDEEEINCGSDAWLGTKILMDAALAADMKIHLAGHSAGVFLLANLLNRLHSEKLHLIQCIDSLDIFAPVCRSDYFIDHVLAYCQYFKGKRNKVRVYNLTQPVENGIDPAMLPYSKSFAHLVSNAFYDTGGVSLAAMDEHWQRDIAPYIRDKGYSQKVEYILSGDDLPGSKRKSRNGEKLKLLKKCSARYHGDFDNDVDTMNYMLKSIMGSHYSRGFNPDFDGFSAERLRAGNF